MPPDDLLDQLSDRPAWTFDEGRRQWYLHGTSTAAAIAADAAVAFRPA